MKALIKTVKFEKEITTKQGQTLNVMKATYTLEDGTERTASFFCKDKDKPTFKMGEINEFQESSSEYLGQTQYHIKKANKGGYNRAVKREQSKYSGFAMSYAKDLVIAGKIELAQISDYTRKMFKLMVELDKTLEND